jgi:hypothetical protein
MKYTLQDFTDTVFSGYDYKLPDSTVSIIQKLVGDIGVTLNSKPTETRSTDNTESNYKKNSYFNNAKKSKNYPKRENIDELWETTKPFKPTNIDKKEGIEKLLNDIRASLNKISNKNYETQRDIIFEHIDKIISDEEVSEGEEECETNKASDAISIANSIFDIASTNKFYSELYATLYKELSQNYVVFQSNIHHIIEQYKSSISSIEFVDPNVNYDKFCDNNKINDKRKALTTFIVNLMKKDLLAKSQISYLILHLIDLVFKHIDIENKNYEIEEITENIFIFITLSISDLKDHDTWENIYSKIKKLSQCKAKEHLSISSRSIFKYMDILDQIKKEM